MIGLLAAAMVIAASMPLAALDPNRGLTQHIRDEWGPTKGYPGGAVYGFTQDADGYLWIAAERGLVRFDGTRFTAIVPPGGSAGGGPTVLSVATTDQGALLTRLRGPALLTYRQGVFEDVMATHKLRGFVSAMSDGANGTTLIASHFFGVLRSRDGALETTVAQGAMPRMADRSPALALVTSVAETQHGIWIGTRDAGLFRFTGSAVERVGGVLLDTKINCLLADPSGDVWVGTDRGVARVSRTGVSPVALPTELGAVPATALLRDRDANIWIAAGAHGVIRVNDKGAAWFRDWDPRTSGIVTALFEDRERNIWIGTSRGIERLRDGVFATYSGMRGVPSDRIGPVYVDASGRTWFAPTDGGLYWIDGEQARPVSVAGLPDDIVYSLDGHGQTVWVGRRYGGVTRVQMTSSGPTAVSYGEADGLAQSSVYVVHDSGDGSVWAGTLSGGVSRLRNDAIETFTTKNGLVSNSVRAIDSRNGATWFATPDGVSRRLGEAWSSYRTREGLPSNDVAALSVDADGNVWAGTTAGLAVLRANDTRFKPVTSITESVLALRDDLAGYLWCVTADRLFRVSRRELLDDAALRVREYDAADGLISRESAKRPDTLRTDPSGRVWFATTGGLSVADPSRFRDANPAAVPMILDVTADDVALAVGAPTTVPSSSRRVSISFAAVSLSLPERIRYRYRLDPFDADWSHASDERTAVYTNLRPGAYTFRVVASDSAGQWSGGERAVAVNVLPAIWQTTWFRLALLLSAASVVWALYRIRLVQIERQLNVRFEERLGERTRIAQELHDTLLQGFLSVSMHLHVATQQVPEDSPARSKLGYVRDLMGKVIEDGRQAIRGLRTVDDSAGELKAALTSVAHELGVPDTTEFRATVHGSPRALHPLIRDDVYRIAREAITNAIRHAHARLIDVTLDYNAQRFVVTVKDDGVGIADDSVLTSGREGHWGLAGMRERAERIGGRLTVTSKPGSGTAIELSLRNRIAFHGGSRGRRS